MSDTPFSLSYIATDTELETLIGGDKRTAAIALMAANAADQEAVIEVAGPKGYLRLPDSSA